MNVENLEKNKEILYRKGFGTELNQALEQQFKTGAPEFTLERNVKAKNDDLNYILHYKRDADPQRDQVYLNSFTLNLTIAETGEVRTQNFAADKLITAAEAYRMLLHGKLVAVNKNLINKEGEKYNTWISIDVDGLKNEYGNYPLQTYHENYYRKHPFDLKEKLGSLSLPVKELESATYAANIEKYLRKANLIEVTIMHDNRVQKGFLAVNPELGQVVVLDSKLKLLSRQEKQQDIAAPKQETPPQAQQDEKKNSANSQRVNWPERKNSQHKGWSR